MSFDRCPKMRLQFKLLNDVGGVEVRWYPMSCELNGQAAKMRLSKWKYFLIWLANSKW